MFLGTKNVRDIEFQCFTLKIDTLAQQIKEGDSNHSEEINKLKEFLVQNEDLLKQLSPQLKDLEIILEQHSQQLEVLTDTVKAHGDDILILKEEVQDLKEKQIVSAHVQPAVMYKNHLYELATKKGWPSPEFTELPSEKGFIGQLLVNGVQYMGTTVFPSKVAAHQEVAKLALEQLELAIENKTRSQPDDGRRDEAMPTPLAPPGCFACVTVQVKRSIETAESCTTKEDAIQAVYKKLAHMLKLDSQSSGASGSLLIDKDFFTKEGYSLSEERYEETKDKMIKCKITFSGKFEFQGKDSAAKKGEAEQEAAKVALCELAALFEWDADSVKVAARNNYKGKLQELLAKQRQNTPTYRELSEVPVSIEESASFIVKGVTESSPNKDTLTGNSSSETPGENSVNSGSPQPNLLQSSKTESSALQDLLNTFGLKPPHVTFSVTMQELYGSKVTVAVKDLVLKTLQTYNTKEEATKASYKELGLAMGILDDSSSVTEAMMVVNEFFLKNGSRKPEATWTEVNNKDFKCHLSLLHSSFFFFGTGEDKEQAEQEAAKVAFSKLAGLLEQSTVAFPENYKEKLQKLLQKYQETPHYEKAKSLYKAFLKLHFKNYTLQTKPEYHNKKLAHREVSLLLLRLLGENNIDESHPPRSQVKEWFEKKGMTSPDYKDVQRTGGFGSEVTFSVEVQYTHTGPQKSQELAEEKLKEETLKRLKLIAEKSDLKLING
nr:PREDICTED: uncharacterized protein LOC102359949 [Latimeria chalumnae]|eukprot:XP_005995315.2 PREDICTED: uncharacterized protein LOC102359949 [Latimeria chalumnae]